MGTRQVFVDESMKSGYLLVGAFVVSGDLVPLRRVVRGLIAPGARRLHMVKESPRNRRVILQRLVEAGATATIYAAGADYRSNIERRRACLDRLVADSIAVGPTRLCLETAEGVDDRDRRHLVEITRARRCQDFLTYEHTHASQEPLLSVPDAIAWAWAKGGEWQRRARPLVSEVVAL